MGRGSPYRHKDDIWLFFKLTDSSYFTIILKNISIKFYDRRSNHLWVLTLNNTQRDGKWEKQEKVQIDQDDYLTWKWVSQTQ